MQRQRRTKTKHTGQRNGRPYRLNCARTCSSIVGGAESAVSLSASIVTSLRTEHTDTMHTTTR